MKVQKYPESFFEGIPGVFCFIFELIFVRNDFWGFYGLNYEVFTPSLAIFAAEA